MKHQLCRAAEVPSTGSRIVPFFGREVHAYRVGDRIRAAANVCLHFGGSSNAKTAGSSVRPAPSGSRLMFLSTRVEGDALIYLWGE
jgi:hypothetical protein